MTDQPANLPSRALQRWRSMNLSTRLSLTLLPLVLITMVIAVGVTYQRARALLRQQAVDQLTSAANSQIEVLQEWASELEQRVQLGTQRSEIREITSVLLNWPESAPAPSQSLITSRQILSDIAEREGQTYFSDILLVRTSNSEVLASTNPDWEGQILPAVQDGEINPTLLKTTPLYDDSLLGPQELVVVTSAPMRPTEAPAVEAALIGVNADLRLGILMEEMQVFWEQRGIYRVERGRTYMALSPDITIQLGRYEMVPEVMPGMPNPIFDSAQSQSSDVVEYSNSEGVPVLAAYEWLPDWDLGVVVELPQADIFAELNQLTPFIIILLAAATFFVALVVWLVTGRSLRPLGALTTFTERIARGQWEHRVPVQRQDEIGRLSRSFNRMAEEISTLYRSLEDRVQERTRQIRTASEVARDAVSITDIEQLLDETVHLISARFGYYHAGVFLLDETGENAVLRAASSEGGKKMLAHGHSLPVGKMGIVGYVMGTGNPRIALDVGEDAYHFSNPDLPETRSELSIPLRSGADVIGALDVQSELPNAFDEDDVLVLQTLGDQLAVAIENAHLIRTQQEVARRRRRIIEVYNHLAQQIDYAQLVRQIAAVIRAAFEFPGVAMGLVEGDDVVVRSTSWTVPTPLPKAGERMGVGQGLLGQAVSTSSTVTLLGTSARDALAPAGEPAPARTMLAAPLISRGRVTGALAVSLTHAGPPLDHEREVLELTASQVAVSLENARLFEETQDTLRQVDALYRRQTADAWREMLGAVLASEEEAIVAYNGVESPEALEEHTQAMQTAISLRGEVIGQLDLLSRGSEDWSEDDREILQAVAEEVAGALEQVRLMDELQRKATQLQTAAEIARDASGLLDVNTLLTRAVDLLKDRFDLYHVSVYTVDEEDHVAVLREGTETPGMERMPSGYTLPMGSTSIIGHVTQTGECYVASDVAKDRFHNPNPLLPATRSELGVPIRIGDRVIGALDLHSDQTQAFTEDDIAVFEALADQLAVAMQNATLFEQTVERMEQEQGVLDITSKIRASTSIESMLQTAVRELRQALGAKQARIHLVDASTVAGAGNGDVTEAKTDPTSGHPPESETATAVQDEEAL
jgi:GAF domain-containing protein/HAMP domain-containing protein